MEAINFYPSQCILAEGPYWHAERGSFFWVDIEKGVLYECPPATMETRTWKFDHRLSLVVEAGADNMILALDSKIARFDLETGQKEYLLEVEKELPDNRFNDGACDAEGRLWIGTMSTEQTEGAGAFYKVEKNLKVEKMLSDLTISNGLAWTADNKTLYHIDSPTQQVDAYHFDLQKGEIEFDRTVITIPEEMGTPDGMSIDREGKLWIGHYGGHGVFRWDPDTGELLEKIDLPTPNVTACAFGGENLDLLLVTTARENLRETQLAQYPESGDVFLIKTNTQGFPPHRCRIH
jgi:sugar lactone lactonase YvrE